MAGNRPLHTLCAQLGPAGSLWEPRAAPPRGVRGVGIYLVGENEHAECKRCITRWIRWVDDRVLAQTSWSNNQYEDSDWPWWAKVWDHTENLLFFGFGQEINSFRIKLFKLNREIEMYENYVVTKKNGKPNLSNNFMSFILGCF